MKILIAEDNNDYATMLKQILSEFGECTVVSDGSAAVTAFSEALAANTPFDLICLDILMPNMNGHEALRSIRKLEDQKGLTGYSGVRIVMTTALEDEENIEEAMKAGCEGYVFKSAGAKRLIKQLKDLGLL